MAVDASDKLVLIDGSGYIFRAYHALPPMYSPDGTPVNAVFGFTKMLLKLIDDLAPHSVAVIFDAGRVTFRNDIYADYKANRTDPPDELVPQFDLVRQAAEAMSLPVIEMAGFEADDLIASYAKLARAEGRKTIIVSSDKDLMQLVNDDVEMLDPMKVRRIGHDEVIEKFGVTPDKVIDVQALAGDSTDNVPGVPGIGIKTAAELINQFGDLEALLAGAETIKQPKRRQNLIEFAEMARISRQLVALSDDVALPMPIDQLITPMRDKDRLVSFVTTHGFKSLATMLGAAPSANQASSAQSGGEAIAGKAGDDTGPQPIQPPQIEETHYQLVTNKSQLEDWVAKAYYQGFVAVDTETTSLSASLAELVGISMAIAPGKACYIPLRHQSKSASEGDLLSMPAEDEAIEQIDFDQAISMLKPLFEDQSVLKIGHNLKYDAHVLARPQNGGIRLAPVDDTMCMSYVLDAGRMQRHNMDVLADHWLGHQTIKYEDLCGKGKNQISFDSLSPSAALDYAAEDADITLRLWQMLKPRLAREGVASVYERLERPLIPILADMEAAGIQIDDALLRRLSNDFASRIASLEADIHQLADMSFNIASPKQLGEVLFDKLGLEGGKKSKTGAYATGADILEDLAANGVEIARKVLDFRQLAKLKSTYTDALVTSVHPETKRVHTSYSMVGASTGRLSSSDPNLQNIPIRTAEGRQIREAFIAKEGHSLISADYSQIELRLVAHVAGEASMLQAFSDGVDIHAQTAAEVFGIPLADMDSETRRRAKAINFGIIYGISAFGLARQLSIPRGEAQDYISAYFARFPGIRDYMEDTKAKAREDKFVETLFGRRIHIGDIATSNPNMRAFAERQAINAPIQGSAADIIKRAMMALPPALAQANMPVTMLLQVHDELIFEAPTAIAEEAASLIRQVMEGAHQPVITLDVPLIAEAGIAQSWALAH
ncbi:MAG: DNA polymerase I [Candidatus Puniceispirillaceae bacterium]